MRKRFITLGLIAAILFVIYPTPVTALAQEPSNIAIQPFWTNVNNVTVSLLFSGTTANCYASIGALSGTSNISGTMKL